MLSSVMLVACGGGLGSVARFATITLAQILWAGRFPYGTLMVNCLGSFLIGLFMSLYVDRFSDAESWRLFIVVGFLGGYTTFSSFAWDSWSLYSNGQWLAALINLMSTNVLTMVLLLLGVHSGRLIGGG